MVGSITQYLIDASMFSCKIYKEHQEPMYYEDILNGEAFWYEMSDVQTLVQQNIIIGLTSSPEMPKLLNNWEHVFNGIRKKSFVGVKNAQHNNEGVDVDPAKVTKVAKQFQEDLQEVSRIIAKRNLTREQSF